MHLYELKQQPTLNSRKDVLHCNYYAIIYRPGLQDYVQLFVYNGKCVDMWVHVYMIALKQLGIENSLTST